MDPIYRKIALKDIDALFTIRGSTSQNRISRDVLYQMGITEASVTEKLNTTYKGWLCEAENKVVGFVMGNGATGEVWVLAVLQGYEGNGIGRGLIELVTKWLWSCGNQELWLTTPNNPSLRAYGFYRKMGWEVDAIKGDDCVFKLKRGTK